jgi:hypothetical protein
MQNYDITLPEFMIEFPHFMPLIAFNNRLKWLRPTFQFMHDRVTHFNFFLYEL